MNHDLIKKILNTSHDKSVGESMDEWGEAANGEAALISIAASLREVAAQLQGIKIAIVNGGTNAK